MVELDDRTESIAEICRRVAAHVEQLDVTRPSYVHLRRLVVAERTRRDDADARRKELLEIAGDVYFDAMRGHLVDAYEVADRVRNAGT